MKKPLLIIDILLAIVLAVLIGTCVLLRENIVPGFDMTTNSSGALADGSQQTQDPAAEGDNTTTPSETAFCTTASGAEDESEATIVPNPDIPTIDMQPATVPPEESTSDANGANSSDAEIDTGPDLGTGGLPIVDAGDIF